MHKSCLLRRARSSRENWVDAEIGVIATAEKAGFLAAGAFEGGGDRVEAFVATGPAVQLSAYKRFD